MRTRPKTPTRPLKVNTKHRFELAAPSRCMLSNQPTGFLDLPIEIRLKIYRLVLAEFLKHSIMVSSSIHVRRPGSSLVPPISSLAKHQIHEPGIARTTKTIRAEVLPLLYAPDIPVSYTFHSCDTSLIRKTLQRIRTEDIPLRFHLCTLTFSLPKKVDDNGLATPWLVSLAICLAWCLHSTPSDTEVVITEPEICFREPYVAVNETVSSSVSIKKAESTAAINSFPQGTYMGLSTTATDLVTSFLEFASGLPADEMDTEEQVIFALADFVHARVGKCKDCIVWRSVWKMCLRRIYGAEVAKSMAKERKVETSEGLGG